MTGAARAFGSSTRPSTSVSAKTVMGRRAITALKETSLRKAIVRYLSSRYTRREVLGQASDVERKQVHPERSRRIPCEIFKVTSTGSLEFVWDDVDFGERTLPACRSRHLCRETNA